jgi:hypothetical protein
LKARRTLQALQHHTSSRPTGICIWSHPRTTRQIRDPTRDDQDEQRIEPMLFAGSDLDNARAIFADFARKGPRPRLTIRQRPRVLERWPDET